MSTLFDLPADSSKTVGSRARGRTVLQFQEALADLQWDKSIIGTRRLRSLREVHALGEALRGDKFRIVLTNGSFDLLHLGHSRYLEEARSRGDFLVVGVDSDQKIRARKNKSPLVPEEERLTALAFQRGVGAVYLKSAKNRPWALLRALRPDCLVTTVGAYSPDRINEIKSRFKCAVDVLPRMHTTSTSARLRDAQKEQLQPRLDQ